MGAFSGAPVDMKVTILSMLDDYMHAFPQRSGEPYLYPAGHVVALRCGSIDIVVGSERCQCFSPSIFIYVGINPMPNRLLIPNSAHHLSAAFPPLATQFTYPP